MTEVVAALIWRGPSFLICRRPAGKARGLLWEFVGGKLEPGETGPEALVRECREELDIAVTPSSVFMEVTHEYPDLTVHLTLYNASADGEPRLIEHSAMAWITPEEIGDYEFCPADEAILREITARYGKREHAPRAQEFSLPDSAAELDALRRSVEGQLFGTTAPVERADHDRIHEIIHEMETAMAACEQVKLRFGILHDLIKLKNQGFAPDALQSFYDEDLAFLQMADEVYADNLRRRETMFGYPANMQDDSFCTQYLRGMESRLYLMNNCGDPYQKGNYGMDSKSLEQRIITMMAENLGLAGRDYWGYITSGGTEGNFWAIREGAKRLPGARIFFSADAHYSIEKYVTDMERRYVRIPTDSAGRMDVARLREAVEADPRSRVDGVVVILTWGTTCSGAIDDVAAVTAMLSQLDVPYFCHVDAAHYGGIPAGQKHAPVLRNAAELGIDTVAVSFHKYIGVSRVNGIVLALSERQDRQKVDYIGQEDTTLLGSRDYSPLSTYQKVREMMCRTGADEYHKNIRYFASLLDRHGIPYTRAENGNIFVIEKPSDALCNHYQLADFTGADGTARAHIIIFPHHKPAVMDALAARLAAERGTESAAPAAHNQT